MLATLETVNPKPAAARRLRAHLVLRCCNVTTGQFNQRTTAAEFYIDYGQGDQLLLSIAGKPGAVVKTSFFEARSALQRDARPCHPLGLRMRWAKIGQVWMMPLTRVQDLGMLGLSFDVLACYAAELVAYIRDHASSLFLADFGDDAVREWFNDIDPRYPSIKTRRDLPEALRLLQEDHDL